MPEHFEIDGKNFLPIKKVLKQVSYTRDYVTRLAREKKIDASYVGRQWFVNLESLKRYVEAAETEKCIRQQQLSLRRKQEKEIHSLLLVQKTKKKTSEQALHLRAAAVAVLVLSIGFLGGAIHPLSVGFGGGVFSDSEVATVVLSKEETTFSTSLASADDYSLAYDREFGEVRSLGEVSHGVLLFPQGKIATNTVDMFSDELAIETMAGGQNFVTQVDKEGNPVGRKIPFVPVPVKSGQI